MALYLYLKSNVAYQQPLVAGRIKNRLLGLTLIIFGFAFTTIQLWPIVHWQLYVLPSIESQSLLAPQGVEQAMTIDGIYIKKDADGFSYFIDQSSVKGLTSEADSFLLTIPKLNIKDAIVLVNSQEFYKNLAHFPGSALPGKIGNVFITGHSALPQFFNPKDYKNIFSTLIELKNGDLVDLKYAGQFYQYQIISRKVVSPDDVSVILPIDRSGSLLTLMTCVPPGLNTQRLIMTARLVGNPNSTNSFH